MSNDKTLVDAQPGGRVRLGDQLPPLPASSAHCPATGEPLFSVAKMKLYAQAALSAQPSPGGQGDWRAMLSQFGEDDPREGSRSNGHDGVDHNDWVDHAEVPVDVLARIADALAARQPVGDQCPDDLAVDAFAAAMKAKMAAARAKGRGGWEDPAQCTAEDLSRMLRNHVEKGDPRDVANFCMMLHQRGEAIAARQPVGEPVPKSVGIDALVKLLEDEAAECEKAWTERADTYMSGRASGFLLAADYFRKIAINQRWSEFLSSPAQAVDLGAVREALQAAEGLATVCASVDGYSREEVAASGRAMKQQFPTHLPRSTARRWTSEQ